MHLPDEEFCVILGLVTGALENLQRDISLCKTREEHIRMTARANEIATILARLNFFVDGPVSRHDRES